MISKEDFNKVWKDSTREDILNQFYFEHNDLKRTLNTLDKAIKYINENIKSNYFKRYDDEIYRHFEELLEILMLGEEND